MKAKVNMAIKQINTLSDLTQEKILKAKAVPVDHPADWEEFVKNLIETANSLQPDCMGLSANQIWEGSPETIPAICIISWKGIMSVENPDQEYAWNVLYNPTGVGSGPNIKQPEGCLSFPGKVKMKRRKKNYTITWASEHGVPATVKTTGLLARVAQHEIDHLNGILLWKTL
jgi:peptide deformylase